MKFNAIPQNICVKCRQVKTFVILQADKAIAELRSIASNQQLRPFGLCAGEFIVPDNFDSPF